MPAETPSSPTGLQRWAPQRAVLHETVALHASRRASAEAAQQALRWLIDTVGCAIAGRHADEVRRFEQAMHAVEPGAFALPGGQGLGVFGATQVLAMAATWDEACEGHALAHGRPGVPLIAALLPLALQRDAGLDAFVDAFVLGYEVGARAGMWLRIRPGMHVDANWPALGVAAGVARLLGLDAAGIVQAIDIAACQLATSLYLPVAMGRTARNTYLAHSALLGLQSAFASAAGIDAPRDALLHDAEYHAAASTTALPPADESMLLGAYLKPFAAVRHVHYGAVAARTLRDRLQAQTRGIDAIELTVYEEATVYCGNRAPRTPIQAQFSLSFGIAAMLRFGDVDPSVYTPARFDDTELRRLEGLVVLQVDAALTAQRQRGATLRVRSAGETHVAQVGTIAGDAAHPLDREALCAKFVRYATDGVDAARAMDFCDALLDAAPSRALSLSLSLRDAWQRLVPYPSSVASASVVPAPAGSDFSSPVISSP